MVCLYQSIKTALSDAELSELFFKDNIPEKLGLANVTEVLLGTPLDKRECVSIWNSRPLRFNQLVYAAKDSFTVIKLEKFIREKLQGYVDFSIVF